MKKGMKKAFTLVELLVVIAILAVLSTVAVVGYNSFTSKANISADEQAVTQMNKVLQVSEVADGKAESPMEAAEILVENGYNGDFTTYYTNYELMWLRDVNRMVLVEDGKIVYPEEYSSYSVSETNTYYVLADLPSADTTVWEEDQLYVDEIAYTYPSGNVTSLNLDAAMNFSTDDTLDSIAGTEYEEYYVDFVIRANQDIDFTGCLWGYYESFGFDVAIPVKDLEIKANEANNVMKSFMQLTYTFIVESVQSFDCGIQVSDATKEAYPGLEITLELWMYEDYDSTNDVYTGKSYLIGTPHTFAVN